MNNCGCLSLYPKSFGALEAITSNIIHELEERIDEKLNQHTSNIALIVCELITHPVQ